MLSLGATFTDSVVLAETQTINGGDTATVVIDSQTNTNVGVSLEEERSKDNETGHVNETVGIVAFNDGLIPCFTAGTLIQTPEGPREVQMLQPGDLVTTADHGAQPIRWIGRRDLGSAELHDTPALRPVRIMAHALGENLPRRDLLVSRQHRMVVASPIVERMFDRQEVLVAAIKLIDLPGIFVDQAVKQMSYLHLLLDDHQVLFAEGAATESLYLGDEAQKALSPEGWQELRAIFPHLTQQAAGAVAARYIPTPQRQKQLVHRHAKNKRAVWM